MGSSFPLTLTLSPKGRRMKDPELYHNLSFSRQAGMKCMEGKLGPFLVSSTPWGERIEVRGVFK
jgi:hypothetical protein